MVYLAIVVLIDILIILTVSLIPNNSLQYAKRIKIDTVDSKYTI